MQAGGEAELRVSMRHTHRAKKAEDVRRGEGDRMSVKGIRHSMLRDCRTRLHWVFERHDNISTDGHT